LRLKTGDEAPEFSLAAHDGSSVTLTDYRGRKVLLYFYPRAGTSGCTRQAEAVREARAELARKGIEPLGISPDKPQTLRGFHERLGLNFTLLSDSDRSVAAAYGVLGEKSLYGKKVVGVIRSVMVIDERGRVLGARYGIKPEETVPLALSFLP